MLDFFFFSYTGYMDINPGGGKIMEQENKNNRYLDFIEKSQAEIDEAESLRRSYGGTKEVCPYYFVDNAGQRFELEQLSEKQIINFCGQSIEDFIFLKNNRYIDKAEQMKAEAVDKAQWLINAVHKHCDYEPSWGAMKAVVQYTNAQDSTMRSVANDIFGVAAGSKLRETEAITRFIQEAHGNFEKPTAEQMCQVIDQKIINEQQKKLNYERTM